MRTKLLLVLATATLVAACAPIASPTSASRTSASPSAASAIAWSPCHDGLECASVDVPLDSWHELPEHDQEQVIGRHKRSGAPLSGRRLYDAPILEQLPPHAHIRQAARSPILRRGYDTEDGLLFLAFMNDPRRQYVPLQRRLAAHDALHAFQTAKGSAVFAVPPVLSRSLLYAQ